MSTTLRVAVVAAFIGLCGNANAQSVSAEGPAAQSGPAKGGAGPHAYFEALSASKFLWKAISLRDAAQVLAMRAGTRLSPAVTYDTTNDDYVLRQDGAKVVIPADRNSLPNILKIPLGTEDGHTYLFTWDAWFGPEYAYANTGIPTHKQFQFSSNNVWLEVRSRFSTAAVVDLAKVDARGYARLGPNVPPNIPFDALPSVGSFSTKKATWTRYWVQVEQHATDWSLVSLWVADQTRDPVQILDRVQMRTNSGSIEEFWLEYNTSTDAVRPTRGSLVSYVRNFVALRDAGKPQPFLVRPVW